MRFVLLCIAFLSLNASAETYYIDDLVIETSSNTYSSSCISGAKHSILVTGSIGPDSTFAVGKLIDQREPCTDVSGEVISPIEVTLESGGGYLEDGYKLGKVFRDRGVTTIIPDDKMCASSCAVAFLGGKKRLVAHKGSILFHAPYLKQMQLEGKQWITCDLPKEELQALNDYYSSMTSVEVGDRLYERTMWYCSAENGWTIKGAAAAELYGIATEKMSSLDSNTTAPYPGEFILICESRNKGTFEYYKSKLTCPAGFMRLVRTSFTTDWTDVGYSDGYAVGYNTTCEIRATLVEGNWDNQDYMEAYSDGYADGAADCRRSK